LNAKLIKSPYEVSIENMYNLSMLEIGYNGTLVADFKEEVVVILRKNKIRIYFKEIPQSDVLMQYYGNFKIVSVFARDRNNIKIKITRKNISDEVQHITSKWNESTTKYNEYNKSNRYIGSIPSLISYTYKGKKVYKDSRNKAKKESKLSKAHLNKLNRIGSNYGVEKE
tara:strand:- start:402 stop:908 length:507 start_codon:yes stop_codon:yes gene_type:complete